MEEGGSAGGCLARVPLTPVIASDPAVIGALSEAMKLTMRQPSRSASPGPQEIFSDGPCPQHHLRALGSLAGQLGFFVRSEETEGWVLGKTGGLFGDPPLTITLSAQLSGAALARVLGHELAHVILRHQPETEDEAISQMVQRLTLTESPPEEIACELASAAVWRALRLGTGTFSAWYVQQRCRQVEGSVRKDAMLAARVLWAALKGE